MFGYLHNHRLTLHTWTVEVVLVFFAQDQFINALLVNGGDDEESCVASLQIPLPCGVPCFWACAGRSPLWLSVGVAPSDNAVEAALCHYSAGRRILRHCGAEDSHMLLRARSMYRQGLLWWLAVLLLLPDVHWVGDSAHQRSRCGRPRCVAMASCAAHPRC